MSPETLTNLTQNNQQGKFYAQLLQSIFPELNIPKLSQNATKEQTERTLKHYLQILQIQNISQQNMVIVIYIKYVELQIKQYFEKMIYWYNRFLNKYYLELNYDLDQCLKDNKALTVQQLIEKDSKILIFDKQLQDDFFDFKIVCYIFQSSNQDILNYKQITSPQERLIYVFRLLQRNEIPIIVPQQYLYQQQQGNKVEQILMRYMFIWQHIIIYQCMNNITRSQTVPYNQQINHLNNQNSNIQQYMNIDDFIKQSSKYYEEQQLSSIYENIKNQNSQHSGVFEGQKNIFIANRLINTSQKPANAQINLKEDAIPQAKQLQTSEVQTEDIKQTLDQQTQTDVQVNEEPQISIVEENITQDDYPSIQEQTSQIFNKMNQHYSDMPERYSTVKMIDDLDISNIQQIQMTTTIQEDNEDEGFFKGLQNDLQDTQNDDQVNSMVSQVQDPMVKSKAMNPDSIQKQHYQSELYINNCRFTTYNGKQINVPIDVSIYFNPQRKYLRVQFFQNKNEVLHFYAHQIIKVQKNLEKNNLKYIMINNNEVTVHIPQDEQFNKSVQIFSQANKKV